MTDAKASSTTSQAASVMLAAGRLDDSAHSGFHRADDGRWLFVSPQRSGTGGER